MRSFKKGAKIGLVILIAGLLVGQLIRLEKSNPPTRADSSIDVTVKPVLKRACYDCHSNETIWPWYSSVAPVSWLVASDVKEGRRHLNFSEWGSYPAVEQSHLRKHIAEEVEEGAMPPWYYSMMHRASRLEPAERDRIISWTAVASAPAEKE
jgi:hypothetical protein